MKRQGLFGLLMILVASSLLTACGGGGAGADATATPARVDITTSAVLLTEPGQTKVLSARVLDSQGRDMTATVAWESTQPGQISVDSAGLVTALGEGGSAQITARVGGLKSAPLLVFHSRVPEGTLLLTDAQIVGEPVETDPLATPSISNTYSVRLSGVAAPAVGQLLLNTEAKIVVGRVQAVSTDANGVHTVTLVLVPLREILPTLRIDETIDLSQAEMVIPADVLDTYDVTREGTRLTFTPKPAVVRAAAARARPAAVVSGTMALPPFKECEGTVEGTGGADSLPFKLSKVPGFSLDFKPALDILHTPENGLERLVLAAEPGITTDLSLELTAGFDAKYSCGIDLAVVRIPMPGPVAAFLSGLITFGAGMELSGKVELPGAVQIINVTQRSSKLDLGVACPGGGSCSLVHTVSEPTVTNQASISGPDLGNLRLEPSLFGFGKAQLAIGNPIFTSLRFNAVYAKLGVALQSSFSSMEGQIADPEYASKYGIAALLKAGLDTDFQGLAAWLGLNGVAENLIELSAPLASSPQGNLTLAQDAFQSGERVEATVQFDPATTRFLSIYNVDEVIVMRKVGTAAAQEVARIAVAEGLDRVTLSFVALSAGTASELTAFVTSRALPAQKLELGRASAVAAVKGDRISAGYSHTCALTSAGGVKCWGGNFVGQLGDGSTTNSPVPVAVSGLGSGVGAIAVGDAYTCALTEVGAVKCWGYNWAGQLGDGSTTNSPVPVTVSGLDSGVVAVSAGARHACALTSADAVQCWGHNDQGQLGDGSTTQSLVPVAVSGLDSGVVAVSAGFRHACALTSVGGVKCWGNNGAGQLGDGSTTNSPVPVAVSGLGSGVRAIAAGSSHTCALTSAGAVKCWGNNYYGQLGDGSTTRSLVPVAVSGLDGGVIAIAADDSHTCAHTSTGAQCWGENFDGKLGDGSTTNSPVPVAVSGLDSGVVAIDAGRYHTCVLTSAGGAQCWGDNSHGQLGDGSTTVRYAPVPVTNFP
ncbi:hypothetical protein [Hydrogenophaga sp.]|uniref:RCC1 domain-containing protein n=1 Tax=Hydrogenophaga sp. TaxID=1904254 RepID=UPI00286E31E6|nr:hypothetical protein [Hydrogenophaga sp.]